MDLRVLIVDDDQTAIKFLERILSKRGVQVDSAVDGVDALEKISASPPDAVFCDVMMPRMDGYELFRKLRESPATESLPFVFLSAKDEPEEQLKGLRMGADEYLTKPFSPNVVSKVLERIERKVEQLRDSGDNIDIGGNLAQVGLNEIVQVIEMNEKSGELILYSPEKKPLGKVHFDRGCLIHAESDQLVGPEAFFDLLTIDKGSFKFFIRDVGVNTTIADSNMALLMEGARRIDEAKAFYQKIRNDKRPVRILTKNIPDSVLQKVPADTFDKIFAMAADGKSFMEIIEGVSLSRIRAARLLYELVEAGVLGIGDENKEQVRPDRKTEGESQDKPPVAARSSPASNGSSIIRGNLINKLRELTGNGFSGIIDIKGRSKPAAIYLIDGRIINAAHGDTTAKKALFRIFAERGGACKVRPGKVSVPDEITGTLGELIKEAESEVAWRKRVKMDYFADLCIGPGQRAGELDSLEGRRIDRFIIDYCKRNSSPRLYDLIEASPWTDFETIGAVDKLRKAGFIKVVKAG